MTDKVDNRLQVNETIRRVISTDGHQQILSGVRTVDNTGHWTRLETDQGYVIINPNNVLMYIIKQSPEAPKF